MPKVAGFYINSAGKELLKKLKALFPEMEVKKLNKNTLKEVWEEADVLIFVMATGIVVRSIASLITEKRRDPGVLVISEGGEFVISLIGGHQKNSNLLAKEVAMFLRAKPVITTASDLKGIPAFDNWIKRCGLKVLNPELLPKTMGLLNQKKELSFFVEADFKSKLFPFSKVVSNVREADVILTNKRTSFSDKLVLIAPNLWIGIGLHSEANLEEVEKEVKELLSKSGLEFLAIKGIATIEEKCNHPVLIKLRERLGVELRCFKKEELKEVKVKNPSIKVSEYIGVESVCEASAILASGGKLVVEKHKFKDFTVAVAEEPYSIKGKLFVVGTGPGDPKYMCLRAVEVLFEAEVIIGYKRYLELISSFLSGKLVYSLGMTEEIKRAKLAIEEALGGRIVALVSGGDPGIYGMAGLVLELIAKLDEPLDVEVVPGISALNACASLAGAPLTADFCVISLSDRLIPFEEIMKRLEIFAKSGLPIVMYNPGSKGRRKHILKAKEILLKYRSGETPVAIVKDAMRDSQKVEFIKLSELSESHGNMSTTVIIGGKESFICKNWLITPRGYSRKYR